MRESRFLPSLQVWVVRTAESHDAVFRYRDAVLESVGVGVGDFGHCDSEAGLTKAVYHHLSGTILQLDTWSFAGAYYRFSSSKDGKSLGVGEVLLV